MLFTAIVVLLSAAVAAAAATFGTVVHQVTVGPVRGHWLPLGVLLAVTLTGAVALLLRAVGVPLLARVAAVVGWLAVALGLSGGRPGGDVLIPANARGYTWLGVGFVVLLVVLVLPGRRPRPARVPGAARVGE